jgi:alpha-D-ribose 1-methylphosphonate 5-triphosphate diphosphatase PhnM
MSMSSFQKTQVSGYLGKGEYRDREAYVYVLAHDNYAAQAVADGGRTTFRLGEFPTEEEAEMACEDYVMGVPYE